MSWLTMLMVAALSADVLLFNLEVTYIDGEFKNTYKSDSVNIVVSVAKQHTDAETLAFVSN